MEDEHLSAHHLWRAKYIIKLLILSTMTHLFYTVVSLNVFAVPNKLTCFFIVIHYLTLICSLTSKQTMNRPLSVKN